MRGNGSLKNATGRSGVQKEAEMFQVEVGCSFEQIKRERKQTTAVVTKPLWRAQFRRNCVELSLLAKSLWQHFWNRILIISVKATHKTAKHWHNNPSIHFPHALGPALR